MDKAGYLDTIADILRAENDLNSASHYQQLLLVCGSALNDCPNDTEFVAYATFSLIKLDMPDQALEVLCSPFKTKINTDQMLALANFLIELDYQCFTIVVRLFHRLIALIGETNFLGWALFSEFLIKHIYGTSDINPDVVAEFPPAIEKVLTLTSDQKATCMAFMSSYQLALRDFVGAEQSLRQSLAMGNSTNTAQENLGYLLLNQQKLLEGFKVISVRDLNKRAPELYAVFQCNKRLFNRVDLEAFIEADAQQPLWLLAEQGIGDQILHLGWIQQFLSLLDDCSSSQLNIKLVCDARLVGVYERALLPFIKNKQKRRYIFGQNENLSELNADTSTVLWLADIPLIVSQWQQSFDRPLTIPAPLKVSPIYNSLKKCSELLKSNEGKLRLGISWCSPSGSSRDRKDIPLNYWTSLIDEWPGTVVSLQYGDVSKDIQIYNKAAKLRNGNLIVEEPIDQSTDIELVLAHIQSMDVIVTSSNSLAHLAGLIGKRTLVLPPFLPLWYWEYQHDSKSLFYPSVTIYRRTRFNDYAQSINVAKKWLLSSELV
jgi:hypothetical protein